MKRGSTLILLLLAFCAVGSSLIWMYARWPVQAQAGNSGDTMEDSIDQKAQKAKSNEESAVRELADEIFATPYFAEVPSEYRESMKERVVRDELKFRNGKKGVKEEQVVHTVNKLAQKFNAPDYARTSSSQVRALRVRLMRGYPNFIAQETRSEKKGLKKKVGDSINTEMSPLEAVFVTGVLLQQKMLNEDFQHAPQEWEEKLRKKELKKWEAGGKPDGRVKPRLMHLKQNDKRNEMRRVITQSASSMSLAELMDLPDQALDDLGIER